MFLLSITIKFTEIILQNKSAVETSVNPDKVVKVELTPLKSVSCSMILWYAKLLQCKLRVKCSEEFIGAVLLS